MDERDIVLNSVLEELLDFRTAVSLYGYCFK